MVRRVLKELKALKDQWVLLASRDHKVRLVRKVQLDQLDCEVKADSLEPLAVLVLLDQLDRVVMWVLMDQEEPKVLLE